MNLDDLRHTVANLTLYDVKSAVRKVQNVVMNYTEMEAKVREATNNEPWGASSTLMNEIALGTHNYHEFNEVMSMIYKRFTDKSASEWRQVYKSLVLLEYLIKNGAERVVDDARAHITMIKVLKNFHYIDENGRDQGANVCQRAKELTEMLNDNERIRQERRKAKSNKSKYTGGGNDGFAGSSMSNKKYSGFGSEDLGYGGYSGGVYGDGGGFTARARSSQDDYRFNTEYNGREATGRRQSYDEYDDGERASAPSTFNDRNVFVIKKPQPKTPEVDLFSFDDEAAPAAATASKDQAPNANIGSNDSNTLTVDAKSSMTNFEHVSTATTENDAPFRMVQIQSQPVPEPSSIPRLQPPPAPTSVRNENAKGKQIPVSTSSFNPATNSNRPSLNTSVTTIVSPIKNTITASDFSHRGNANDAFGKLWTSAAGKSSSGATEEKTSMDLLAKMNATEGIWESQPATKVEARPKTEQSSQNNLLF